MHIGAAFDGNPATFSFQQDSVLTSHILFLFAPVVFVPNRISACQI